jgi:hypothetical protein
VAPKSQKVEGISYKVEKIFMRLGTTMIAAPPKIPVPQPVFAEPTPIPPPTPSCDYFPEKKRNP